MQRRPRTRNPRKSTILLSFSFFQSLPLLFSLFLLFFFLFFFFFFFSWNVNNFKRGLDQLAKLQTFPRRGFEREDEQTIDPYSSLISSSSSERHDDLSLFYGTRSSYWLHALVRPPSYQRSSLFLVHWFHLPKYASFPLAFLLLLFSLLTLFVRYDCEKLEASSIISMGTRTKKGRGRNTREFDAKMAEREREMLQNGSLAGLLLFSLFPLLVFSFFFPLQQLRWFVEELI